METSNLLKQLQMRNFFQARASPTQSSTPGRPSTTRGRGTTCCSCSARTPVSASSWRWLTLETSTPAGNTRREVRILLWFLHSLGMNHCLETMQSVRRVRKETVKVLFAVPTLLSPTTWKTLTQIQVIRRSRFPVKIKKREPITFQNTGAETTTSTGPPLARGRLWTWRRRTTWRWSARSAWAGWPWSTGEPSPRAPQASLEFHDCLAMPNLAKNEKIVRDLTLQHSNIEHKWYEMCNSPCKE